MVLTAEQQQLERVLGYSFKDRQLFLRALTHRSASFEDPSEPSNERLEFLGDAVLGLVVSTALHESLDLAEGEMSKVRAAVVNEAALAEIARSIELGGALRLGRGEDGSGGRTKAPILADALEAVVGALYLDGGLAQARKVVLRHWSPLIARRSIAPGERDYKTRLQEVLARQGAAPKYRVEGSGPDHDPTFNAVVLIADKPAGRGVGPSKKRAQQAAAREALSSLGELDA